MVRSVPTNEKLFTQGDMNVHVGTSKMGLDRVHGGFG
jgi:hypothetical protein